MIKIIRHFFTLALCLSNFTAVLFADDIEIWQSSASMIDSVRIMYTSSSSPTKERMEVIRKHEFPSGSEDVFCHMFSCFDSEMVIMRQGDSRRFKQIENILQKDLIDAGRLKKGAAVWTRNKFQESARTTSGFIILSRLRNVANIWPENPDWPTDPENLLDMVMPPLPEDGTLSCVDKEKRVYEYRKATRAIRWHLDPSNGMMPVRIEYYQITPKRLFLNRFIDIEHYEYQDGVFVPAEAVIYNYARGDDSSWSVETKVRATNIETNVKFVPDDFKIQFPPGTTVHDNILNITYVVGTGDVDFSDTGLSVIEDMYADVGTEKNTNSNSLTSVSDISPAEKTAQNNNKIDQYTQELSANNTYIRWIIVGCIIIIVIAGGLFGFYCRCEKA